MIGKLTGRVDSIGPDHAIIDVGGVGYVVHCPSSTLSRLSIGATASLSVETKVSDEAIRLYGFLASDEREWFRLLQTVQGVGARVALSILSALKIPELERAVVLGDKAVVGRAQGVGPKLATRIVTELKDKAPAIAFQRSVETGEPVGGLQAPRPVESDAIAALVKLGYSQIVAAEAVARAGQAIGPNADALPLEALLRESLRQLAR
jgi:Holliday junction DNA helicase RuvA